MCGRFAQFAPVERIGQLFGIDNIGNRKPIYNVTPAHAPLLARNAVWGSREIVALRWGLVPYWAKGPLTGNSFINAPVETIADNPAFRVPIRYRRCLIAADGYYEWEQDNRNKQPYYISLKSGAVFAFAGIWDRWERGNDVVEACAILVTEANELIRPIHEHMPVILSPSAYNLWMDPKETDPSKLTHLYQPYPAFLMQAWRVSKAVNDPKNNTPSLLQPVDDNEGP